LARTVGECGGRGFIDDTQHFEAGETSGILRGEALAFVKKSGDRDDGLGDGATKVLLGGAFEFTEDQGADFLWPIGFPPKLCGGIAAHEPLDGEYGVFRSGNGLVFRSLPDDDPTRGIDANGAGHGELTLHWNDRQDSVLDNSNGGIGRTEVDADDEWRKSLVHDQVVK
jgi:NAD-specific glutamate dehydrogenase